MSISKKLRFEVFKRDGFTCQYCGKTPPEVTLEIDHIQPKSKEGTDDIDNLITSCFDCNRGKSNIELERITPPLKEKLEVLKEQEEQLQEYQKIVRKRERRVCKDIEKIAEAFEATYPNRVLSDEFKGRTLRHFLRFLSVEILVEAMHLGCSRVHDPEGSIKYFCGVCWRRIKGEIPPWEK